MRTRRPNWIIAASFVLACAGCSTPVVKESERAPQTAARPSPREARVETKPSPTPSPKEVAVNRSEQELQRGIQSYEEAAYKLAARQFQSALDLGLEAKSDQAKAHKYLAFIWCISGRERACRDEFHKALAADPSFELEVAEAGHPIWGPVFRNAKAAPAGKPKSK